MLELPEPSFDQWFNSLTEEKKQEYLEEYWRNINHLCSISDA